MNKMILSTKIFRKLLFSFAILMAFQTIGYSESTEAVLVRLVKDYARAYENITKTRDKQSVLQYVSKDLFSTIIKSNVVDNFGLIQSSYADLDSYLEQVLRTDGMEVKYEVRDI